jgi:hypothetical protein
MINRTQDDAGIVEGLSGFLAQHPPTIDDVLSAACETYRISPSEIDQPKAKAARAAFCYLANRWCGASVPDIASTVGLHENQAHTLARNTAALRRWDMLLRDDLDLMALRVADWVMLRYRHARQIAPAIIQELPA